MQNLKKIFLGILLLCFLSIAILGLLYDSQYLLFGFLMIIISIVPIFIRFEAKVINSKEIVLISILSAIAALSRVPFSSIPFVKPTSFVIIITGVVFGSETGFLVGAVSAMVSNLFLGQGPWTPWQIFAWGMMGFSSGFFKGKTQKYNIPLIIFGLIWGFLFGWIMDLWFVLAFINPINFKAFILAFSSSFYLDLGHAFSNVLFIVLFYQSWINIFVRVKKKYGLMKSF